MTTYFNVMFQVFSYGALVLGALLLVVAVLLGVIWALAVLHDKLPFARCVELAVAIRLHGRDYSERMFWRALHEKASVNEFAAKEIIRNAEEHLPPNNQAHLRERSAAKRASSGARS